MWPRSRPLPGRRQRAGRGRGHRHDGRLTAAPAPCRTAAPARSAPAQRPCRSRTGPEILKTTSRSWSKPPTISCPCSRWPIPAGAFDQVLAEAEAALARLPEVGDTKGTDHPAVTPEDEHAEAEPEHEESANLPQGARSLQGEEPEPPPPAGDRVPTPAKVKGAARPKPKPKPRPKAPVARSVAPATPAPSTRVPHLPDLKPGLRSLGRAQRVSAAGATSLVGSARRCDGDVARPRRAADRRGRGRGGGWSRKRSGQDDRPRDEGAVARSARCPATGPGTRYREPDRPSASERAAVSCGRSCRARSTACPRDPWAPRARWSRTMSWPRSAPTQARGRRALDRRAPERRRPGTLGPFRNQDTGRAPRCAADRFCRR